MSFTAELKNWFFRTTAPLNTRGAKINLADKGEPDQDLFERLAESVAFKTESGDRAKLDQSALGVLSAEVGLVAATTGTKAKAGTSGLEADRTLVALAENLPNTIAGIAQFITGNVVNDYNAQVFVVADDLSSADRNKYAITFHADFITWLEEITTELESVGQEGAAIRTTTGSGTGAVNMGTWAGAHTLLTDSITAKAAFEELEAYLDDIGALAPGGGAWVNINANASVLLALEDIDAAITAAGGETNTISLLGGTNLFNAKAGVDYPFRGAANGTYINANVGATSFTFDLDSAAFLAAQVAPTYLTIANKTTVTDVKAGAAVPIVSALAGNNYNVQGALGGTGIDIVTAGNNIDVSVNQVWLDAQIAAAITTPLGDAWLFSAVKITEQTFNFNTGGLPQILTLTNDSSPGNYDYGNSWLTSKWTAPTGVPATLDFDAYVEFEITTQMVTANVTVVIDLYLNGVSQGTTGTVILATTDAVGVTHLATISSPALAVVATDEVEVKIKSITPGAATAGAFKATVNSRIWNAN